jgi:group I intron endonuclease
MSDTRFRIYLITNTINGNQYIGSTTRSISHRWRSHIDESKRNKGNNRIICRSIRKYGIKSFNIQEICSALCHSDMTVLEQHFIREYQSKAPFGYNMTDGGEGIPGFKMHLTDTHIAAMRAGAKRFEDNPNNKAFKSKIMTGRMSSDESRKRQSNFASEYWSDLNNRYAASIKKSTKFAQPEIRAAHLKRFGKPVIVNGIYYPSLTDAGNALGVTKIAIRESIKRRRVGYMWATS